LNRWDGRRRRRRRTKANLDHGEVAWQGLTGIGALDVLPIDESPQDPGDQAFVLVVWHVLLENHQKFCAIIEEWVNADSCSIELWCARTVVNDGGFDRGALG
jgi:hypothetical protein